MSDMCKIHGERHTFVETMETVLRDHPARSLASSPAKWLGQSHIFRSMVLDSFKQGLQVGMYEIGKPTRRGEAFLLEEEAS